MLCRSHLQGAPLHRHNCGGFGDVFFKFIFLPTALPYLVYAGAAAIVKAIQRTMRPKSNLNSFEPDPATADEIAFPTNDEDRPVPILYGTQQITPQILALGSDLRTRKIKVGGITVGHGYFMDQVWGLCAGKIDGLIDFAFDGQSRVHFYGLNPSVYLPFPAFISGVGTKFYAEAGFHGAPGQRSNNTNWTPIYLWDGSQTSVAVANNSGHIVNRISGTDLVYYHGVSLLVAGFLEEALNGDFLDESGGFFGDNVKTASNYRVLLRRAESVVPAWTDDELVNLEWKEAVGPVATPNGFNFVDGGAGDDSIVRNDGGSFITDRFHVGGKVRVRLATTGANDGTYTVTSVSASTLGVATGSLTADTDDDTAVLDLWTGVADANPAHIVYDLLTTHLGINSSQIDTANFQSVAATLATENLGLSIVMNTAKTAASWLEEIKRHCDMEIFRARATGLWTLKLIRDDYGPVSGLTQVDLESDCESRDFVFRRRAISATPTDINVKFVSRQSWDGRTVRIVNPAARQQLGRINMETISFPYLTSVDAVEGVIQRLKQRMLYPLATVRIRTSRDVIDPDPGDVFKLASTSVGGAGFTDLVLRVVGITHEDPPSRSVLIDCVQDLFAVGDIDIVTIADSQLPSNDLDDPVRFPTFKGCLPMKDTLERIIFTLAARPTTGNTDDYEVQIDPQDPLLGGVFDLVPYAATGQLTAQYAASAVDHAGWDSTTGFTVDGTIDIEAVSNTVDQMMQFATPVIIDSGGADWELCSVQTITDAGGGNWTFSGIMRGCAGTDILTHADNARVWVLPHSWMIQQRENLSLRNVDIAQDVTVEFTPVRGDVRGPLVQVTAAYDYRPETPRDPSVLVGTRFTAPPSSSDHLDLGWNLVHRWRGAVFGNPDEYPAQNEPPEAGTSYQITADDGYEAVETPVNIGIGTHTRDGTAPDPVTFTVKALRFGILSEGLALQIGAAGTQFKAYD